VRAEEVFLHGQVATGGHINYQLTEANATA
jgi:hypothetical protein